MEHFSPHNAPAICFPYQFLPTFSSRGLCAIILACISHFVLRPTREGKGRILQGCCKNQDKYEWNAFSCLLLLLSLSLSLPLSLCLCLSICLCFCLSLCLSPSLSLPLSLPVSVWKMQTGNRKDSEEVSMGYLITWIPLVFPFLSFLLSRAVNNSLAQPSFSPSQKKVELFLRLVWHRTAGNKI